MTDDHANRERKPTRDDPNRLPNVSEVMADETLERRRQLSERIERALHLPMVFLAIVFLAVVVLPELVVVSAEMHEALDAIDWLIWALFAFELGVMTYLAPDRRRYLITHWVDVLTVLLPFLRPFRLLRIAILGARVWEEVRNLIHQRTFSTVAMTSIISALIAATLVYAVERGGDGPIKTYPDALWWAAATVTTVGYGDVFPKTSAGRGIAFLLMLVGISVFGLLTARVAAIFVEANEEEDGSDQKLDEVLARLERLEQRLQERSVGEPASSLAPHPTTEGRGNGDGDGTAPVAGTPALEER